MNKIKFVTNCQRILSIILFLGELVNYAHGADAPLIRKMILDELDIENEVKGGTRERTLVNWEEAVPGKFLHGTTVLINQ